MAQRSWPRRFTYWLTKLILRLAGSVFFGLRCRGVENYPRQGGALVCSNHQSYIDPVFIGACCPRRLNYVARETLFRGPFGQLFKWFDAIPIQREGIGIGGLKESLRRLKRGEMLLIFPEGTRTRDGKLQPLQPGFVALARRANVPIVPAGIDGAYQAWPRSERWPHPDRILIEIGAPISPAAIEQMNDDDLVAEVTRRIDDCFQSARAMRGESLPRPLA